MIEENKGIAIGLAIGVALGVALDNIAVGISLGIVFGVIFDRKRKQNPKDQDLLLVLRYAYQAHPAGRLRGFGLRHLRALLDLAQVGS